MNATRPYRIVLWTLVILQLTSVFAWAQVGGRDAAERIDRLRQSLDQTYEMVGRAEEAIRNCDNPAASVALEQGRTLLAQANDRFANAQYEAAAKLMVMARDRVKVALSACHALEEQEANVQRRLDRAQDLLDRAGELLTGVNTGPVVSLYESARNNLARAWEFYQNREFRPALKLADQVENAAKKILSMQDSSSKDENLTLRQTNAEQALEKARQDVATCGDEVAKNLLEQAEKAFVLAHELGEKGQYGGATAAANNARELALRASRRCESNERLTSRLDQLKAKADQFREQVQQLEGSQRSLAEGLLEQVYSQLEFAQRHLDAGERGRAEASLQAAQLLLRQLETALK